MKRLCFSFASLLGALHAPSSPAADSSANLWRTVAQMPADNHDLTAAVVGGKFYVAGGATNDFKGTGEVHAFDEIWALDPRGWTWQAVAKFARPRIYCATAAFADRVWVIGGDVLHEDGQRRPSKLVEIYDPGTGVLSHAVDLPVALPNPIALAVAGRLWVVGARNRTERGQFFSLGPDEAAWRIEPAALPKMWALAGAALADKLYVCVPDTGLAEFDPATRAWHVIPGPTQPRSAQVAAWRGELWIMGGVDLADRRETRIYNPSARTWRTGPPLPQPLAWGAAGVIDDQLVITGGAWREPTARRGYTFTAATIALRADAIPPLPIIAAAGHPLPRWSDQKLRGTGGPALAFTSERVFPHFKFGRLGTILPLPGQPAGDPERLVLMEIDGVVWSFPNRPDAPAPERMLDLRAHHGRPMQAYSIAFHPRFPAVPQAFVLYNLTQPKPAENFLSRVTVTLSPGAAPVIEPASEVNLLRWPSDGHNGGEIAFGPDGLLYVSTGDRSQPGDRNDMGQRVDLISGGVLRIDIDHTEPGKNYAVPADNPFVGQANVRPEIWAYGLRNPWRLAFGPNGDLWAADNGDDSWESVHLIRRGANYGWSVFEGTHPFKRNRALAGPTLTVTPPVIELPHSEARSVIGGLVYRGEKFPALRDHYLFGDYVTGGVWAFRWDGTKPQDYRKIAETHGAIIAFGIDRAGEILMTRNDGQIHRLIALPTSDEPKAEFPRRLSEIGLFTSAASLAPAPGVVPYEINAGVWSDGARTRRHLAVSGWQKVTADAANDDRWMLPDGSAVARTMELNTNVGPRRVETQLMYREQGVWRFYTYAWNEAQTDAELVVESGESRAVPGAPNRTWRFAARSECTICHTPNTHFTIGLSTAQLNRDADFTPLGRRVENQIAALADAGLLKPAPTRMGEGWPRRVAPADVAQPLELRVRSYLDINCAHCHRPNGVGGRAAFQMVESVPLTRTGLINGTPLVPLLGPGARVVTPGAPERSELFHRITLKEGGRMPLLGSEQPDPEGIELIRQWIAGLGPTD
jgi:glucose/arabinose dehydrogenase